MDFFESQELARKNTRRLVWLFGLAVLSIIAAVYFVSVVIISSVSDRQSGISLSPDIMTDWRLILLIVGGVVAVITLGTTYKILELRGGGSAVAALMGGRRLQGTSKQITERRVMNVVQEMALASGVPVPPVYLLDNEDSINAFAAGYTVNDAVIAINRGTAEKLTREELQGVVAHEFSHILNGDMRMSLRMVGILHGILLISLIGAQILNSLRYANFRSSNRDGNKGGGVLVVLALGASLYVIGLVGLFFGRLIKATISRQREYLADASAVQFTRDPDGIAGALKMIGATPGGSVIQTSGSEQISHMFFANSRLHALLSTHPPLLDRIRRIDNSFDGDFIGFVKRRSQRQQEKDADAARTEKPGPFSMLPGNANGPFPINPLILIAGIGIPTDDDVRFSKEIAAEIPKVLRDACRDPFMARCVVFASLLDQRLETRQKQIQRIHQAESRGTLESTIAMEEHVQQLPKRLRLPVFEIVQGTLSSMSPDQYPTFRETIESLILADQTVDVFEFFLHHHLIVHLDRCFNERLPNRILFKSIEPLKQDIAQMLSMLTRVGQRDLPDQLEVFRQSFATLFAGDANPFFVKHWDHAALSAALRRMSSATPMVKKSILTAAVKTIVHDNVLTVEEVELFRAMSESIDCPVPPLAPTRTEAPDEPHA